MDRRLLDEQIAYYRARAAEYDATTMPPGDPFAAHTAVIQGELRTFDPAGHVLEIACGTGQWTAILAELADSVTALDAAPEMLERNRRRVGRPEVRYEVADIFAWTPARHYDVVMFGFFLSHVPATRFGDFWARVAGALRPEGRVFFVDESDHGAWDEAWEDRARGIVRRTLLDGTAHRAVKVLWEPAALEARLRGEGWVASVRAEGPFYWGTARRRGAVE